MIHTVDFSVLFEAYFRYKLCKIFNVRRAFRNNLCRWIKSGPSLVSVGKMFEGVDLDGENLLGVTPNSINALELFIHIDHNYFLTALVS